MTTSLALSNPNAGGRHDTRDEAGYEHVQYGTWNGRGDAGGGPPDGERQRAGAAPVRGRLPRPLDRAGKLAVRNGRGAVYEVDAGAGTCDCPFFRKSGRQCKHILGWGRLLARQRACRLWIAVVLLRAWGSLDDRLREEDADN